MKDLYALLRFGWAGLRTLALLTLLVGLVYPLAITGLGQAIAPWQSNGSLVTADGERTTDPADAVGSALLGQTFDDAALFLSRPSAAGDGYDPLATGGSNLGPESPDLLDDIAARKAEVAAREGVPSTAVPSDAVTASASGLDPHISQAYAALQVPRVAAAQSLSTEQVEALVADHTEGRVGSILGEPRVNVLELNLAVLRAAR